MGVIVRFRLVTWMVMVMRAVVARVVMVVHLGSPAVRVLMEMFVQVLVSMAVGMVMAVRLTVMRMFVGVRVIVVVRMQMFVFVLSFHN
ncbi:MAG TPA: hypothetical protein VEF34_13725 [Syntrophobacteraceae bacterium]|nr:hypothetical protein [Syntrophobacteraceae bacterium]